MYTNKFGNTPKWLEAIGKGLVVLLGSVIGAGLTVAGTILGMSSKACIPFLTYGVTIININMREDAVLQDKKSAITLDPFSEMSVVIINALYTNLGEIFKGEYIMHDIESSD